MTPHDPDTARWDHMRRLSARAALLARAEENQPEAEDIAALSPPDDDHVPTPEDARDAALAFAALFGLGWVIYELMRAAGVL